VRTRTSLLAAAAVLAAALQPGNSSAVIPEPEHIFHGTVGTYGVPLASGEVTAVLEGDTAPIATFTASAAGAGRYVLRIPIDSVDPQAPGTARPGMAVQFFVAGSLAGVGVVGDRGTATALNLDRMFDDTVSITDGTVTEPDSGTIDADFTLTLSEPSPVEVRVNLVTVNGTATFPADYAPLTTASAVFPAGVVSQVVKVVVNGDALNEANETFFVDLASPVNTNLGRARGVGTILDNDAPPLVSIADAAVSEGNPGPGADPQASFTVSLSSASGQTVSVDFSTADGTAGAGSDYASATGTVVFPAGSVSQQVQVTVLRDTRYEANETFAVNLAAPQGLQIADGAATGAILNDDRRVRDFDGDGKSDLAFHNVTTGALQAWFMDGVVRVGESPFTPNGLANLTWQVVGTGDLDNDGRTEFLWRNSSNGSLVAWMFDGVTRTAAVVLNPNGLANLSWSVKTIGDFDGNGTEDLVWQHATTGQMAVWYMNGTNRSSGAATTPNVPPDPGWRLVSNGDFDGDAKADLVFQHDDGRIVIWMMDGVTRVSIIAPSPDRLLNRDWYLAGVGHFDADTKPDFLWRNKVTGQLTAWFMDGVNRRGASILNPDRFPHEWRVVAPK
jgi:hypothetical protein